MVQRKAQGHQHTKKELARAEELFRKYNNDMLRRNVEGIYNHARHQAPSTNANFHRGYQRNPQQPNPYGSVIDGHQDPELLSFAEKETARLRKLLPQAATDFMKEYEGFYGDIGGKGTAWTESTSENFWEFFFEKNAGDIHGKLKKAGVDVWDGKHALYDSSGKYIDKDASGRIMDVLKDKKL